MCVDHANISAASVMIGQRPGLKARSRLGDYLA
jgi:hypothetical protein